MSATDDEMVIRRSQAVSPFGVGSMFEVLGQSFVACDTTFWHSYGTRIDLPRLAKLLGVDHFKLPPSNPDFTPASLKEYLPFMRFPQWQLCASCRRISKTKKAESAPTPTCQVCKNKPRLAPIRYINICKNGHLSDINWHWWVHSSGRTTPAQKQCQVQDALFWRASRGESKKQGEFVKCEACGAIGEVLDLVRRPMKCSGIQPWSHERYECSEPAVSRPRGATNVHFPFIQSGLDIPDKSVPELITADEIAKVKSHRDFKVVSTMTSTSPMYRPKISKISNETLVDKQKVESIVVSEKSNIHAEVEDETKSERLEVAEWRLLQDAKGSNFSSSQFLSRSIDIDDWGDFGMCGRELMSLIAKVVVIDKVREVRALKGFARYEPNLELMVRPSLGINLNWLPAIEVYGEGLFVSLNMAKIKAWESSDAVRQRSEEFVKRSRSSFWGKLLPTPTPRLILLHTLAHLVIRSLSFSCGYSSSSLRERIYSSTSTDSEEMAGILVYTSSGDSEGSLGGLARQGESSRFIRTLITSLRSAEWCSSDPVCGEIWSGPSSLNHAACHVCSLLPETSCQFHNMLLDRSLVIDSSNIGFFNSVQDLIYDHGDIN